MGEKSPNQASGSRKPFILDLSVFQTFEADLTRTKPTFTFFMNVNQDIEYRIEFGVRIQLPEGFFVNCNPVAHGPISEVTPKFIFLLPLLPQWPPVAGR
jgi:hypothetical protein